MYLFRRGRLATGGRIVTFCLLLLPLPGNSSSETDEQFIEALRGNRVDALSALIDRVDDVDLTPADGRTALMFLAKRNEPTLVRTLLERGANANAANSNGGTPLMYAAISGNVDIVKAIVDAGGRVDARGSNGWSAMMVAAAKGHTELVAWLVSIGADVDAIDVYGWTPLVRASYENRIGVVQVLLESTRAAIDHKDDQGATSLHHAAGNGFEALTRILLTAGANPLSADHNQLTPLDRAQEAGQVVIVSILCESLRQSEQFKADGFSSISPHCRNL